MLFDFWFSRFRFHSSLSMAHCDVPQLLLSSIFPFSLALSFTTHPLAEEAFCSFPSYWILGRLYWSFSASPLSPSRQLHVEAPFSPMRDSRMNRRAYWGKERESQSLLFVSLNIFYGLPLSPLPVLNSSVTNTVTAFSCCSFCLLCERGCCYHGIVVDTDNIEREDFFCTSYFKKYIIKPKHLVLVPVAACHRLLQNKFLFIAPSAYGYTRLTNSIILFLLWATSGTCFIPLQICFEVQTN